MGSNYAIITDPDNNSIVCINDIRFKGKRKINWDEIEEYLRQYIGELGTEPGDDMAYRIAEKMRKFYNSL